MFFPELIKHIKPTDRVLEVGPGSDPFPRSDILLEKRFDDDNETEAQRGFAPPLKSGKEVIYYNGGKFPFEDKEFDYVICSHVLEHVPEQDLQLFISELQRVANKGYIEFPNIFYELINYQNVHLWLMNFRDDTILLLDKKKFNSNYIHKIYREMFHNPDQYMWHAIDRYKEFFFCGYEWGNNIAFRLVDDFDDLINVEDFNRYKRYFAEQANVVKSNSFTILKRLYKIINAILSVPIEIIHRMFFVDKSKYFVHKTAQLEKRDLILINKNAEIKDFVIIRTYSNPVIIGEYTQINPFTVIYGHNSVIIGNNVMIAPHCMIASGNHDFIQTEKPMRFAGSLTKGPIIIEDNVWIGANTTITDGVKIGQDAVIAANSVVISDIGPYDIAAGVPAKIIGNRLEKYPKNNI
ncbi:MAG: methyltransferase domain-containing protein [Geobacter sp.]|nr:methyltransferase domain-containing protein [Geobacter sp.]